MELGPRASCLGVRLAWDKDLSKVFCNTTTADATTTTTTTTTTTILLAPASESRRVRPSPAHGSELEKTKPSSMYICIGVNMGVSENRGP